jgi:hypothetical protein
MKSIAAMRWMITVPSIPASLPSYFFIYCEIINYYFQIVKPCFIINHLLRLMEYNFKIYN